MAPHPRCRIPAEFVPSAWGLHLEGIRSSQLSWTLMAPQGYVYIMASKRNGTLYIGVSSDLKGRVCKHKHSSLGGFTAKYRVHDLVYFEVASDMSSAIIREKQLKEWKREWKVKLIEDFNPSWRDLYDEL